MMSELPSRDLLRETTNWASESARHNEQIRGALVNARIQALSLYITTKSSLWYMTGPHGIRYESSLREQAVQLFATTVGLTELLSGRRGDLFDHCKFPDCIRIDDIDFVAPEKLLNRLRLANQILTGALRTVYILAHDGGDVIDAAGLEGWIGEARARAWFLQEVTRAA